MDTDGALAKPSVARGGLGSDTSSIHEPHSPLMLHDSEAGLASAALFLPSVLILKEPPKCQESLDKPCMLLATNLLGPLGHASRPVQNFFSDPALQAIREDWLPGG